MYVDSDVAPNKKKKNFGYRWPLTERLVRKDKEGAIY